MIENIIENLGFKEEEVKIYLLLHDTGAANANSIATRSGLKRPATYAYLDRLIAGGLVTQGLKRGVKIFIAEPAAKIELIYKRKIDELSHQAQSLKALLPEMERRAGLNLMRPRMQFFEGQDGIESALEDILTAPPSTMTYSFWPIKSSFGAASPDFFRYHNKERIRRDIHIQGIWPQGQGVKIEHNPFMGWGAEFKRELRYAPEGVEFTMGYWIYGHKVLFTSSRAESYGFIIESAEMADMMKTQHQIVWNISTPIAFDKKYVQSFLKELEED